MIAIPTSRRFRWIHDRAKSRIQLGSQGYAFHQPNWMGASGVSCFVGLRCSCRSCANKYNPIGTVPVHGKFGVERCDATIVLPGHFHQVGIGNLLMAQGLRKN